MILSLSLSAYMYVLLCFYSVMLIHIIYMTCVQCGLARFLAGCGGSDSRGGGGGGVCVCEGGDNNFFLSGVCHWNRWSTTHFIILKGRVLDQYL